MTVGCQQSAPWVASCDASLSAEVVGTTVVSDIEDVPHAGVADWCGQEASLRGQLLSWYAANRRRLPWRGDPPPWSIDKAGLRRASAAKEKADNANRRQPRIEDMFKRKLASGCERKIVIDLDDEVEERCQDEEETVAIKISAYGTWVSEVMLQQTQVERVVEYWTRWMQSFPTVGALATADADAVNSMWAGLGYYGRARRLHEGAQHVVAKHDGELPGEVEALRRIPGVGPYTAGAIASIAFNLPEAVVDGNVIRVFARLRALHGDAASPSMARQCWSLAGALVDPERPGAFNQALMELGATVCTPLAPACGRCPIRAHCQASTLAASGKVSSVTEFPAKSSKKAPKERFLAVAVIEDAAKRVLLVRRPMSGLLAGQWEFPTVALADGAQPDKVAVSALQQRLSTLGISSIAALPALLPAAVPPVEHTFSHERHSMRLFRAPLNFEMGTEASADAAQVSSAEGRQWILPEEAAAAGVTSGVRKVLLALGLVSKDVGACTPGCRRSTGGPPAKRSRLKLVK